MFKLSDLEARMNVLPKRWKGGNKSLVLLGNSHSGQWVTTD